MKVLYYITLVCSVIALVLYFILEFKWLFAVALTLVVISGTIHRKQTKSID